MTPQTPSEPGFEPSWHTDPFGRHEFRWWDGKGWTEKVRNGDLSGIDPPGIDTAPSRAPLKQPAPPVKSRRSVFIFGRHLPGAMLLASFVLVALLVFIIVVAVIG